METNTEWTGRTLLLTALALLGLMTAACSRGAQPGAREVAEAIAEANKDLGEAIARGDAAAIAAHYTADAMIAPPAGEVVTGGNEVVQKFWQGALDGGLKGLVIETTSLETDAATAHELGRFIAKGADDTVLGTGKYLVVWRRDAASKQWKLHRDIWNDAPTPPVDAAPATPSGQ